MPKQADAYSQQVYNACIRTLQMRSAMKLRRLFSYIILTLSITACGGSSGGGDSSPQSSDITAVIRGYLPADCSVTEQNRFIYDIMREPYFWRADVPALNYASYPSPEAVLEALRPQKDIYSYIRSATDVENSNAEIAVGIGVRFMFTDGGIYLSHVYEGSPAHTAGLRRGNRISNVNGWQAENIASSSQLSDILGEAAAGVQVSVTYLDADSVQHSAVITKAQFHTSSVNNVSVFTDAFSGKKTGYFSYDFFGSSLSEVFSALNLLRTENVNYLIMDLRANGGGSVSMAVILASAFAGREHIGKRLLTGRFNPSYADIAYKIMDTGYDFDLEKIVFITSGGTASASEILINTLKPYRDISIIGTTTYGKPVSSMPTKFCDKYFYPIVFENLNALGQGRYYTGMQPDCTFYEDYTAMKEYGDEDEQLLAAAMDYTLNGICRPSAPSSAERAKAEKAPYTDLLTNRAW